MNRCVKISSIVGMITGIAYMVLSLAGTYRTTDVPVTPLELCFQLVVFAIFFAPFGGAIGAGIGLLLSILAKKSRDPN